jgi:hypothetical protein
MHCYCGHNRKDVCVCSHVIWFGEPAFRYVTEQLTVSTLQYTEFCVRLTEMIKSSAFTLSFKKFK